MGHLRKIQRSIARHRGAFVSKRIAVAAALNRDRDAKLYAATAGRLAERVSKIGPVSGLVLGIKNAFRKFTQKRAK